MRSPTIIAALGFLATGLPNHSARAAESDSSLPCNEFCQAYLGIKLQDAPTAFQSGPVSEAQPVQVKIRNSHPKKVDYYYYLNADCSAGGRVYIGVLQQPNTGSLTGDVGRERAYYAQSNVRSACNGKRTLSSRLFYQRGPRFSGTDQFALSVSYPDGTSEVTRYEVTSR